MSFFDRLGDLLEGRGRTILYGLIGLIVAGLVIIQIVRWTNKKSDEARQALGRAITISRTQVTTTPPPGSTDPTFATDKERAQRAIEEFEKVAAKYGDPYRSESRYFIAMNRLVLDRQKGISELNEIQNSGVDESRKAKGSDNQPLPQSSAAREAADELQKLDPDRYAQLPPETPLLAG